MKRQTAKVSFSKVVTFKTSITYKTISHFLVKVRILLGLPVAGLAISTESVSEYSPARDLTSFGGKPCRSRKSRNVTFPW